MSVLCGFDVSIEGAGDIGMRPHANLECVGTKRREYGIIWIGVLSAWRCRREFRWQLYGVEYGVEARVEEIGN